MSEAWFVYVLVSADSSRTYVGSCVNVDRGLEEHNGSRPGGAKATRVGRPWKLARVHGPLGSRGEAQRVEAKLKKKRGRERLDG